MRKISDVEAVQISGSGSSCIDLATWQKMQARAKKDGFIFSAIVTIPSMAFVYGLTEDGLTTLVAGAILAPIAGVFGLLQSNAYSIFK